ncbi:MAG: hypothetical protein KF760_10030 [Candidatus Eremiobacteraeota bacterium]|nr:hypothetical protein [Candidatus Eremiobacteraeota bacterium]MCW5871262.1 hypothetical protein [Candidatus Eremiobacteraeota bacterium]
MFKVSPKVGGFAGILEQVEPGDRSILQAAYEERRVALGLGELRRMVKYKLTEEALTAGAMRLAAQGLLISEDGLWRLSWEGIGVVNWLLQTSLSTGALPEPRLQENGDEVSLVPCDQYRAFFGAPGYCWCGHPRARHAGEKHNGQEVLARDFPPATP